MREHSQRRIAVQNPRCEGRALFCGECPSESDVDFPFLERGVLLNRSELLKCQFHTWICRFELAHKVRKKCRCRRAKESNREPSDLAPCGSPSSFNSQFGLRERAFGFGIKHLAFRCELRGAFRARKQSQPELFFEMHYRLADRRL